MKEKRGNKYADEYSRLSYETAEKVEKLLMEIPSEKSDPIHRIILDQEHELVGVIALSTAGAFLDPDEEGNDIYIATDQTRKILDKLGIKYKTTDF